MSHTQILHLDGRRELAEGQVLISSAECQDIAWWIQVMDDGSLNIRMHGSTCFDVRPVSPGCVRLFKMKP